MRGMIELQRCYDRVAPKLWQGSAPTEGCYEKFDAIVLCAVEHQPKYLWDTVRGRFRGEVLRAPFRDTDEPTRDELIAARDAAVSVAARVTAGKRVLVTCQAGLNRSGLVSALALCTAVEGMTPGDAIDLVRRARGPWALSNPAFVREVYRACGRRAPESRCSHSWASMPGSSRRSRAVQAFCELCGAQGLVPRGQVSV